MASLIAATAGQADSADFTLTGTMTTLAFVSATGVIPQDASAALQYKSASGSYTTVGTMDPTTPARNLTATGTYRIRKFASSSAIGIDRD